MGRRVTRFRESGFVRGVDLARAIEEDLRSEKMSQADIARKWKVTRQYVGQINRKLREKDG